MLALKSVASGAFARGLLKFVDGTRTAPYLRSAMLSAVAGRQSLHKCSHVRRRMPTGNQHVRSVSEMRTMQQQTEPAGIIQQVEEALGQLRHEPQIPPPPPVVVVISGPSGVGKDAVVKGLKQRRPDLYFVVTATSRTMRAGEVEGKDYFFVSKEKFEGWIARDQLLEHAVVYGEYKGIPRQQVDEALSKGTDVVLRIDVQGAATVRQLVPEAVSIFLVAESEFKLAERLLARKTEPWDKLLTRVDTARQETQRLSEFDYVVVNEEGKLDECVACISAIIDAEKCRVARLQKQVPAV